MAFSTVGGCSRKVEECLTVRVRARAEINVGFNDLHDNCMERRVLKR